MASRGSGAQAKGKAFERELANFLANKFNVEVRRTPSPERWKTINKGDVNARRGTILDDFHWEAKNHATVSVKEWYKKASDDAENRIPVVVFKIPQTSQMLTVVSLEHLTRLLVELQGYRRGE